MAPKNLSTLPTLHSGALGMRNHSSGDPQSFFGNIYVFGYAGPQLQHTNSLLWHVEFWFPNQGSNLSPLYWECGVLATGPPGKSWTHRLELLSGRIHLAVSTPRGCTWLFWTLALPHKMRVFHRYRNLSSPIDTSLRLTGKPWGRH